MKRVINRDCLEYMPRLKESCIDSIVTDPPYGLNFMNSNWDHGVPGVPFWTEALRVLKPGGSLLAFGGTRTSHRLVCAIEDAGFEIRDSIVCWLYGSGFPKSHNISKAIDKAAGAEREVVGTQRLTGNAAQTTKEKGGTYASNTRSVGVAAIAVDITAPATDAAKQWDGWGTALKPAHEPICLARKPLKGTVAANVLEHGTGALNIDGCRVGMMTQSEVDRSGKSSTAAFAGAGLDWRGTGKAPQGRWPANVILDEQAGAMLGEPSRFFYCAKASKKERGEGNNHPTVKPLSLMRYLCRLITPPNGVILDPFCGSGSTGVAALREGFHFLGIEREAEFAAIARARLKPELRMSRRR